VRIISLKLLKEFWTKHPDAQEPLRDWYTAALFCEWKSLHDARTMYPHADGVRTANNEVLTVFNIAGNKYRLIARIRYDYQLINIRCVLTHAEYNREKWKE
jgi:mRNA interferase HigB